ncbi:MAG: putative lipid II flippase FtsW [Clostridiales bacterium]|nr:putative lipid II flippase FtsW [Clostridiales bacterium]
MNDAYYFLKRQLLWVVLGIAAMFILSRIDYKFLGKYSFIALIVSLVLLALVLVPGLGVTTNGATRWLGYGSLTFQPSELVKITLILFFAYSMSRPKQQENIKKFPVFLMYLGIIGITDLLLYKEPHVSGILIITVVGIFLLFMSGARIRHFLFFAIPGMAAIIILAIKLEHVRTRIIAFMDPFNYAQGEGWQVIQSLIAIGSGGLFGRGLGRSIQKYMYLPEPFNDFIFSILAEELGFIGVFAVLALFVVFIWRGYKIAVSSSDKFGSLLAAGITTLIAVQVIMNIAVVTSSMPVTGVALPFFSYGGSSLLFVMADMGILLNVSKQARYDKF